ncbi:MAG: c-type cytochrome [Myxococcales bacterium]|nr:c-type cytochrome [Myxococcales bacterium]
MLTLRSFSVSISSVATAFAVLTGCTAESGPVASSPVGGRNFAGSSLGQPTSGDPAQARGDKNRRANGAAGHVVAVCEPIATATCDGIGAVRTCKADGTAWLQSACESGSACEDGKCRPVICQPGSNSCDANQIVKCNARGVSRSPGEKCAAGLACVGGNCLALACKPSETKCSGNVLATCAANGMGWLEQQCASDQSCETDPLTAKVGCQLQICVAGSVTCKAGRITECDAKGLNESIKADCGALGQACLDAECAPYICEPGVTGCDGANVAVCQGVGASWAISSCPVGQACNNGACAAVTCVANEVFCDGNLTAKCNSTGTASNAVETCSEKQQCKQGKCVIATILCGDGLCDGDEASSCAKDCKPVTILAPDFDKIMTGAPTILPTAPRALSKPALPPWLAGKALKVHGNTLFIVDTDNGNLVVMDRLSLTITATIAVGGRPEQAVVDGAGNAYVASRDAGTLSKIAWGGTKPIAQWKIGHEPWGLALSVDQKQLYVSLTGENAIITVDPNSGEEKSRVNTQSRPRAIACAPNGTVYAVHGDNKLTVAAPSAFMNKPYNLTAIAPSTELRGANPVAACQDLTTKKVRVASRANALVLDPETTDVMVPHVLVSSGSAQDVLLGIGIKPPEKPQQFVVKCSGGYGSTCSKVPVPPPPGEPPCVGTPLRPYELSVSKFSPTGSLQPTASAGGSVLDVASGRNFVARFDQPLDLVFSPTASLIFVAAKGTNNVLVLNSAAADPMQWPLADIKVGDGPKALAISGNGQVLYVLNAHAFTVSEVDLTPLMGTVNKALSVETDTNKLPKMATLFLKHGKQGAYGSDPLSADAQMGRKVYHYANNSRLSAANRFACATCHIEGTEDKQVWFVAEGPRQTPALAERLQDSAPFNWTGSKFTLHENIIATTARMGGSGLLPGELDGLVQFLLVGLKAPPNPHLKADGLTELQLAGKKLFEDPVTACTKCHVSGSLTDGAQHDVGTVTSVETQVAQATGKTGKVVYNTPSLRGLWYSAPYLHDGSAATLKQALQKTSATMGKTSHLSDKQLDELVAYLQTL